MPSKQQDVKPKILSVLFMTLDGEPMSFYLRPGPAKSKLQPLITAGGGLLCKVQQPGAILLIDPEEKGSIPESTAHWYVSTQYIHDCIEKDEQLNLEDYKLNPEGEQRQSPTPSNRKEPSPSGLGGRVAYTPEEDAAILSYVSKHKSEIGGNRLWQQMEKQHVTSHSWQSMKYRYRVRLAHKQSEIGEVAEEELKAAEEETKAHSETTDPLQTQSAETDLTDLTQIDAEPEPAESTQPENSTEAETSSSPQSEEPPMDPQREAIPAECTEPETDTSQSTISPQKENVPEDSQPEPLPNTSSLKKSKEKEKTSPKLVQPQRRSTRRQLELEDALSSQPYSKKLRSASASIEQLSSSPKPSKKTRSAVKSSPQKDTTVDQPPPKRARGKREATVAECQQEESVPAAVSDTVQADEESDSVPQTDEKKKEGRKSGILVLASNEFEDESEPEDEAPHHQNPAVTVTLQPTSTDPVPPSSDKAIDAASTQSNLETGPSLQENVQEALASSSNHLPETSCPQPASAEPVASMPTATQPPATEPAVPEPAVREAAVPKAAVPEAAVPEPAAVDPAATEPAAVEPAAVALAGTEPAVPEPPVTEPAVVVPAAAECAAAQAVPATSKPHLFIFDNESQEEDSQSVIGNNTAVNPQPTVNKEAALSLTQVQLEEDKQRIRELISQTKQDLICVTKALLRTSGDFSAALELLLNPSSVSGPFWNRCDDSLLLSTDSAARQQLQEKYGEEGVAKRIVFLEVEG